MHDPNSPSLRAWNQPSAPGGGFPGLSPGFGNPGFGGDPFFSGPPAIVNPTVLPPYAPPGPKGFSFGELKGIIDRMGGIDGVLSGIGKFQKLMSTMQQMAPILRLFMNKASAAGITEENASSGAPKRKPSRRRRTRARGGRRPAAKRRQR